MKKLSLLLAAVYFLTLTACAPNVTVNQFDHQHRAANYGKFRVFSSSDSIPYKFEEIAFITVDDEGWGRDDDYLLDIAISKAKAIGADGLLLISQDTKLDCYIPIGEINHAVNRNVLRGSAVVNTGDLEVIEPSFSKSGNSDVLDELKKLKKLFDDGAVTTHEYEILKSRILSR